VFIDADPQGSATQWHAVENNTAFEVLHHPEPITKSDIEALAQEYDYLVIDAPPAIGDITKSILAVAELSIIPLSPSSLDIWSCKGWRHKCCRQKTFRHRNVFLTTTIKQRNPSIVAIRTDLRLMLKLQIRNSGSVVSANAYRSSRSDLGIW
jgi:cellulose biosynthesis protein BcsQ